MNKDEYKFGSAPAVTPGRIVGRNILPFGDPFSGWSAWPEI